MNPRTIALLIFAATMRASYGQTTTATPAPEAPIAEAAPPAAPAPEYTVVSPVTAIDPAMLSCSIATSTVVKAETPPVLVLPKDPSVDKNRAELEDRLKALTQRRESLRGEIAAIENGLSASEKGSVPAEKDTKPFSRLQGLKEDLSSTEAMILNLRAEMAKSPEGAGNYRSYVHTDDENKIPILGDLPIVGQLFRSDDGRVRKALPSNQIGRDKLTFTSGLGEVGRRKVTLHRDGVDAMDALTALLKTANASYVIGEGGQRGRKVTVHFNDTPLEDGLGAVAEAAGLTYHVRGNVIIFSPNSAALLFSKIGSMSPVNAPNFAFSNGLDGGKLNFTSPEVDVKPYGLKPEGAFERNPYFDRGIGKPGSERFFEKGPLAKPGGEVRRGQRKQVLVRLQNVTPGNVLKRLRGIARPKGKGDGEWSYREGEATSPDGVRLRVDPSGRALLIDGEPSAVDAMVKDVQYLDRTGRDPRPETRGRR